MKIIVLAAALSSCLSIAQSWALPIDESSGTLHIKDRFYALEAKKGKSIEYRYIIQGITHAPQCATGSISLQATSPESPETKLSVILWPKEESVADAICGLKSLLPLKYPLIRITGTELENAAFSLNGKVITPSKPTIHILPSSITVEKEDTR